MKVFILGFCLALATLSVIAQQGASIPSAGSRPGQPLIVGKYGTQWGHGTNAMRQVSWLDPWFGRYQLLITNDNVVITGYSNLVAGTVQEFTLIVSNQLSGAGTKTVAFPAGTITWDGNLTYYITNATQRVFNFLFYGVNSTNMWEISEPQLLAGPFTNAPATGNATITWDMSKDYSMVSTSVAVTVNITGLQVGRVFHSTLVLSNQSGTARAVTGGGFSMMTNALVAPASAINMTNNDTKHQRLVLKADGVAGVLTNVWAYQVYDP